MTDEIDPAVDEALRSMETLLKEARAIGALLRESIDVFRRIGSSLPPGAERDRIMKLWFRLDQLTIALQEVDVC